MELHLMCDSSQFQILDMFLIGLELELPPDFQKVKIDVGDSSFNYRLSKHQNGRWYFDTI